MQTPKILPLRQALQERNNIPHVTILFILMSMRCHLQSVNNTNGGHTSYWLFVNIFWPWTLYQWFCYSSFCTIALSNGIMPTHVLIECEIFIILIFLIYIKYIIDIKKRCVSFLLSFMKRKVYTVMVINSPNIDKTIASGFFCLFCFL